MDMLFALIFLGFLSLDYKSPRSLGMGGLAVSVGDPQTSFFYNPAGLAGQSSLDIISVDLRVAYPVLVGIRDTLELLPDISENPWKTLLVIRDSFGRVYGLNLYTFPHFVLSAGMVSVGLGVLAGTGFGFSVAVPSNVVLENTFAFTQAEIPLGIALRFLDDTLRVGISSSVFKVAQRITVELRENEFGQRATEVIPVFGKDFSKVVDEMIEGKCTPPLECAFGFGGVNLGAMWTPLKKNFTIGAGIRNILAPIDSITADIGVSYSDRIFFVSYTVGLEFQDLFFTLSDDMSILKRVFFGSEFSTEIPFVRRFVSFMFGLGQTYSSVALELNLKILSFTLGTYAVELGREVGLNRLRYYFIKFSM